MIIAILSILILTSVIWALNKVLPIKICPVCAGVTLTWFWMLFGMGYGLLSIEKYQFVTAILMGGSVVGITNKLEEKYKSFKSKKSKARIGNHEEAGEIKTQMENCC